MSNYWIPVDYSTPDYNDNQGWLVTGNNDEPYLVARDGTILDEEEWMP